MSEVAGNILIVDSNPTDLNRLSDDLTKSGLRVLIAADSAGALSMLERGKPDLILVAVGGSGPDGWEIGRRIKAWPFPQEPPLIFMLETPAMIEQARANQEEWVAKPIQLDDLVVRLRLHLQVRALRQRCEMQNWDLSREVAGRKQIETILQRRDEELDELSHIVRVMTSTLSLEGVLQRIVEASLRLCSVTPLTTIQLYDTESQTLRTRASSLPSPNGHNTVFPADQGIAWVAIRERRVLNVPDVLLDPNFLPSAHHPTSFRSLLAAPLVSYEQIVGTISLVHPEVGVFTDDDVRGLQSLAGYAAVAVQNARLYEQAQLEIEQRRAAEKALLAYTRDLEASNAELDSFSHTVAHDLKNPLTVLIGTSKLLERRFHRLAPEVVKERLGIINRVANKLTSIVDELLLLASVRRMEDVQGGVLEMGTLVSDVQMRLGDLIANAQAELVIPDSWPVVVGYGPWVEEVWANYISNALKYGGRAEAGIPPRVEVGFDLPQDGSPVRFWVQDNGAGLSEDQKARLFTQFERLGQLRIEGHGLGLSIVRRIVEKLGGEVGVESELGQGSRFYFTLRQPLRDAEHF